MPLTARSLSELPQVNPGAFEVRKGSYFFRTNCAHQYPLLAEHMRIWREEYPGQPYFVLSAGCGEGKEPASIVITWLRLLKENGWTRKSLPLTVIAVDIARSELELFDQGRIPFRERDQQAAPDLERYFSIDRSLGALKPKKVVRERVFTSQLDLASESLAVLKEFTPEQRGFHAVLCNWVGYTIKPEQARSSLKSRLAGLLRDDVPQTTLFYEHGYWTKVC